MSRYSLQTPLHQVCHYAHVCAEELGLKWVSVGTSKPEGFAEIRHSKLARTLCHQTMFSEEEFAGLSVPIHLLWEDMGSQKPETGTELINEALATALKAKTEFTADEFTFEVPNVTHNSYIKISNSKYLQPASCLSPAADSGLGRLSPNCCILANGEYFVPAGAQLVRELLKHGADMEIPTKTVRFLFWRKILRAQSLPSVVVLILENKNASPFARAPRPKHTNLLLSMTP